MTSENNWKQLREDYKEKGIALALGAGVSMGCKLPNWYQLLERISEKCFTQNSKQIVDEMISQGFSLPALAGILEARCPRGKYFGEVIRDALYRDFEFYRKKSPVKDPAPFVNFIKTNNPTLSAVAALCAKRVDSNYVKNPSVHAIANSNFDAILRVYSNV